MKRSRLALACSFFGSSTLDVAQISSVARPLRTDALCLGPGFGAGDPTVLAGLLGRHHLRVEAIENIWVGGSGPARRELGEGLADPDVGERQEAVRLTVASAQRMARLGCRLLIVRLGRVTVPDGEARFETIRRALAEDDRDRPGSEETACLAADVRKATTAALDRVCRALFDVLRLTREDPVHLGLVTGEPLVGMPDPGMLEQILEDLHSPRLGYWHDPVRALWHDRLAGGVTGREGVGEWLGRHARRLVGVFLRDCRGSDIGLPPGSGEVDWPALREHLPTSAVRVVRPAAGVGADTLAMGFDFLRGLGLD